MVQPEDRRETIVEAGLAVLRESGFAGFTQPRVAAKAGVRQSHLTYYYPTRVDLLRAVARVAVDRQLSAAGSILGVTSPGAAAARIANMATRRENTRVLMTLVQAADQEPALRELFLELANGMIEWAGALLGQLGAEPTDEGRYLLHAVSVGMAVITLATGREDSELRSARTLETMFSLLIRDAEGTP